MVGAVARVLGQKFFARDALVVAPELLGMVLCRRFDDDTVFRGAISEVEAYVQDDPASHAFRGETPRNQVMFGHAGVAYVYFIYGMYFCLNVVTGRKGQGQAVLIRGVLPIDDNGIIMPLVKQTNGPGKLCRYLNIDRSLKQRAFGVGY